MSDESNQLRGYALTASRGTPLEVDGDKLKCGLWENGVYLGRDGFIYHIIAEDKKTSTKTTVIGKRTVGEYLRWVDGLFQPGELPDESNGIHFRAARRLREII